MTASVVFDTTALFVCFSYSALDRDVQGYANRLIEMASTHSVNLQSASLVMTCLPQISWIFWSPDCWWKPKCQAFWCAICWRDCLACFGWGHRVNVFFTGSSSSWMQLCVRCCYVVRVTPSVKILGKSGLLIIICILHWLGTENSQGIWMAWHWFPSNSVIAIAAFDSVF